MRKKSTEWEWESRPPCEELKACARQGCSGSVLEEEVDRRVRRTRCA
jgi:hypothetical protein